MPRMRVSLTVRFLSHPSIDFGAVRRRVPPARMGLPHPTITYHRPRLNRHTRPTIAALRSGTAQFHFPAVGGAARVLHRRTALPLGLQRARRA